MIFIATYLVMKHHAATLHKIHPCLLYLKQHLFGHCQRFMTRGRIGTLI